MTADARPISVEDVAAAVGAEVVGAEQFEVRDRVVEVPQVHAFLASVPASRIIHMNKRAMARVDDGAGNPTFAELVVASRLQAAGWEARWSNTYGGSEATGYAPKGFYRPFPHDQRCGSYSGEPPLALCAWLRRITGLVLRDIGAKPNPNSVSHMPDVVAWNGQHILLVECKGPGDALSPKQKLWISYAIQDRPNPPVYLFRWKWLPGHPVPAAQLPPM